MLDLVFFEHRPEPMRLARAAGIRTFMVDWERHGKEARQKNSSTEIDPGTRESLSEASLLPGARVYCRINGYGPWTTDEVEAAVEGNAESVFLPMVRTPQEVESFLGLLDGRCRAGILVETLEAVENVKDIASLPVDRVYVGLNDLAIQRGAPSIFDAVADGTVDRVRESFAGRDFGFGGVTAADAGHPVPCVLLLGEMERLGCGFSFCRRSFKRDMAGRDMGKEISRLGEFWDSLAARSSAERSRDRRLFMERLRASIAVEPVPRGGEGLGLA